MAKDFKASQVRTTQIIASGSTSGKPSLLILSASSPGVNFDGDGINNATLLTGVGKDVFLFVSGSKTSKNTTIQGVALFGGDIVLSGTLSHDTSRALGLSSHAEGENTSATGDYSHTEGEGTFATAYATHAEGVATRAEGEGAHAEGGSSTASGDYSHAQGSYTHAIGQYSFTGGESTIASGTNQTALGQYNKRNNAQSLFIIGNGTGDLNSQRSDIFLVDTNTVRIGSGSNLGTDVFLLVSGTINSKGTSTKGTTVFGGDVVISGTAYDGTGSPIGGGTPGGSDTYVQFNDGGTSFGGNSGLTYNKTTNTLSVGNLIVTGTTTTVSSTNLVIKDALIYFGSGSGGPSNNGGIALASGGFDLNTSLVWGRVATDTWGAGKQDVLAGTATDLTGMTLVPVRTSKLEVGGTSAFVSSSIGTDLTISATSVQVTGTFSQGLNAQASGNASHSEGRQTKSTGQYSHAEGWATQATGDYSHSEGVTSISSGIYSHAEGSDTTASGIAAHAEGDRNTASGDYSHAEGLLTTAQGDYAHSEGYSTTAGGNYSHAAGNSTDVVGPYSFAAGQYTIASGSGQVVVGTYNKRGNDQSLFVVGNGTGNSNSQRSDILLVDTNTVRIGSGSNLGTDVFLLVSGAIGSKDSNTRGTALFGGDVVISGTLHGGSPLKIGDSVGLSGSLRLQSQGSAPEVGANEAVLYVIDDGGTKKLYWKNSDNVQQQVGTGGSSTSVTGTFNEVNSGGVISLVTTASVSLAGSKGFGYGVNSVGADTFFFVSGTKDSKGTSSRGTAVFGGDSVVSGSLYVAGNSTDVINLWSSNNLNVSGTAKIYNLYLTSSYLDNWVTFDSDTGQISFNLPVESEAAYNVSYGSKSLINASTDPVSVNIGEVAGASSQGSDTFFFVSGSKSSKGTSTRGTAVFGGDVTISGTLYDGNGNAYSTDGGGGGDSFFESTTAGSIFTTGSTAFVGGQAGIDSPADIGSNISFYVSGSVGEFAAPFVPASSGVSVFGGDLLVSGAMFFGNATIIRVPDTPDVQFRSAGAPEPWFIADGDVQGGALSLVAGNSSAEGVQGGPIILQAGNAVRTDYVSGGPLGGNISLQAGSVNQDSIAGDAGNISLQGGSSYSTVGGRPGGITLNPGFNPNVPQERGSVMVGETDFGLLPGADTLFYVSGSAGSKDGNVRGAAVFGGDVVVSGTIYDATGNSYSTGGGTPGGSDTYVQFNDGGSTFGGDSYLTYDKNSDTLKTFKLQVESETYITGALTVGSSISHLNDTNTNVNFIDGTIFFNTSGSTSGGVFTFARDGYDILVLSQSSYPNSSNAGILKPGPGGLLGISNNSPTSEKFTNIGTDVLFVVSGSIGGKDSSTERSVSAFHGDVVVSGTIYDGSGNAYSASGGFSETFVTGNYAILPTDTYVRVDLEGMGSGEFSITLPDRASNIGMSVRVRRYDTNFSAQLYVSASGADTINGSSMPENIGFSGKRLFIADGFDWAPWS